MASEFAYMEDWDLEAVVRGRGPSSSCTSSIMDMNNYSSPSLFAPLSFDHNDLLSFSQIFDTTTGTTSDFDGLEGLYKPFYPILHQPFSPHSTISSATTSSSIGAPPICDVKETTIPKLSQVSDNSDSTITTTTTPTTSPSCPSDASHVAKPRKRKNQHKRVVQLVKSDSFLSCDKWAWRKYGQKPIKGSPYPRSYYRCSSLKGCPARKQVERSNSDPSIYIITYTAEHIHAHPTRRNSLAGSSRSSKNSLLVNESSAIINNMSESNMHLIKEECSPTLTTSIEEEQFDQGFDCLAMPDVAFGDEFFPSLDDLHGLLLD